MRSRRTPMVLRMLALLLTCALQAAHPPPLTLTLDDVRARAINAPALQAASAGVEHRRAAVDHIVGVGGVLSPSAELLPGLRAAPRGVENPAVQATLTVPFVLADLTSARKNIARAEVARTEAALLKERFDVEVHAITLWFRRAQSEARLRRTDEALNTAVAERAALEAAVAAGADTAIDIADFDAWLADMQAAHLDAEGAALEAGLALGRVVGVDVEVGTRGTAAVTTASSALDDAAVAAARASTTSNAALSTVTQASWLPIFGVGLAAQIDDPNTGFAYVRLSATLPSLDGNPADRAALVDSHGRARAAEDEALRDRNTRRALVLHETQHAAEKLALMRDVGQPAAERRQALLEAQLHLGAGSIRDVLRARRAVIDARIATDMLTLDAALACALAAHSGVAAAACSSPSSSSSHAPESP